MVIIRLLTILFVLAICTGLLGFTELAEYAASIARGLCVIFTLSFFATAFFSLNSKKSKRIGGIDGAKAEPDDLLELK